MELRDGDLVARSWTEDDVAALVVACNDPEITYWIPVIPSPYTEEDALGRWAFGVKAYCAHISAIPTAHSGLRYVLAATRQASRLKRRRAHSGRRRAPAGAAHETRAADAS